MWQAPERVPIPEPRTRPSSPHRAGCNMSHLQ